MDELLARLGYHAVNFAIKSGIAVTSTYAARQCGRLLKTINDKAVYAELKSLQKELDSKLKVCIDTWLYISRFGLIQTKALTRPDPFACHRPHRIQVSLATQSQLSSDSKIVDIDSFFLWRRSGRGNTFLESAVPLAKSLHRDIVRLGKRLDDAATLDEASRAVRRKASMSEAKYAELMSIIGDIRNLLKRIDDEMNLIQFAISTSGETLSSNLPPGISPSRMLQASNLLSFGDLQFMNDPSRPVQIGPSFTLSLYMLFRGHSSATNQSGNASHRPSTPKSSERTREGPYGIGEGERKPIWQEVMHKARVRLCRTPIGCVFDNVNGYRLSSSAGAHRNGNTAAADGSVDIFGRTDEYSYYLEIVEDLDDGRVHDDSDIKPQPFGDISMAGIRESIPIHQISKIFYTDTGRILNIGNSADGDNNPVLLLKRDPNAPTPTKLKQGWYETDSDDEDDAFEQTQGSSAADDEQADIDRQLFQEIEPAGKVEETQVNSRAGYLPAHLDPEWLALEVYVEDDDDPDSDDEDEQGCDTIEHRPVQQLPSARITGLQDRSSVDRSLLDPLRRLSLQSSVPSSPSQAVTGSEPGVMGNKSFERSVPQANRSPFGSIVSSLSLLEMLIRFTSLQEFQQTPHLAIPDHFLTFFLEETSTTGLQGEERWAVRNQAKRRMGFDPYTDTPTK